MSVWSVSKQISAICWLIWWRLSVRSAWRRWGRHLRLAEWHRDRARAARMRHLELTERGDDRPPQIRRPADGC